MPELLLSQAVTFRKNGLMVYDLSDKLVVAISSRALFNLDDAHGIFVEKGLEDYRAPTRPNMKMFR